MQIRAQQGDTLDALCYRHLGRTAGVVEAALRANPGLAQGGVVLKQGDAVHLPDAAPAPTTETLQLWD